MRIVCWQTIFMKFHTFSYLSYQDLSSAAVVIGALRVKWVKLWPTKRVLLLLNNINITIIFVITFFCIFINNFWRRHIPTDFLSSLILNIVGF